MPKDRPILTERYCDLVMKGGITSGIVYPPLVAELANHYQFKNIGGTSAGAIAAAAAAAAEYRRRVSERPWDFPAEFGAIPIRLSEPVGRHTRLFSLFQPTAGGCRRLFRVLVTALNARGTWHRVSMVVLGFMVGYLPATLMSGLAGVLLGMKLGVAAGVLSFLILFPITVGLWVYRDFTRSLVANDYGMCTGMTAEDRRTDALTPWLHALIQDLAGKRRDAPLTFEDLWGAPGFPPDKLHLPADVQVRSIDLRMFTTNLSTGRPFVLPLTHETCRLFFQTDELARYLPDEVIAFILANANPYSPASESDPPPAEMQRLGLDLWELPPGKWPVVLAARLSLGFPLLFSAIPFWAIDYDPPPGKRTFKRCLFSDGGISSNFPIHMFDGLLPIWPTFGIQLEPKLKDRENLVFLPKNYFEGYGERWDRFDEGASSGRRMGGFLAAIVGSMQNWIDNTNARMPGVRDRVVRIRLKDNEGGLNLDMPPSVLTEVARRGKQAAELLIERFAQSESGWKDQRWVRLRVLLNTLRPKLREVGLALGCEDPVEGTYFDLIEKATVTAMDGEHTPITSMQRETLLDTLKAIESMGIESLRADDSLSEFKVVPPTDLRIRPSI